jgi:polyisoprenoid-binding protein YceI
MPFALRFAALTLAMLACASCTAVKVVTHTTSADPVDAPAGVYHLDPHHWSLTFDVDHFGYSRFVMRFDKMTADLDFHPDDPAHSSVSAHIAANSLDTNVADLDEMVRGDDLLDAEHFPEITFVSHQLRVTGKHTLGFSAMGHFSRSAFGLGRWYPAVGREIQVRIEAEFESEAH